MAAASVPPVVALRDGAIGALLETMSQEQISALLGVFTPEQTQQFLGVYTSFREHPPASAPSKGPAAQPPHPGDRHHAN